MAVNKTNVEDTNLLISDYTEDDIDVPNDDRDDDDQEDDENDDMDVDEGDVDDVENVALSARRRMQTQSAAGPSTAAAAASSLPPPPPPPPPPPAPPVRPHNPPSTTSLPGATNTGAASMHQLHPTLSTAAVVAADSPRRRRAAHHHHHQNNRAPPAKSRRQSSSLNRPIGETNESHAHTAASQTSQAACGGDDANNKYQRRTRSTDRQVNRGATGITAITTLQIGQNGEPITVTSEIQHQNRRAPSQESVAPSSSALPPTPGLNRVEVAYMPSDAKVRFSLHLLASLATYSFGFFSCTTQNVSKSLPLSFNYIGIKETYMY